jgi:hypothetical protein
VTGDEAIRVAATWVWGRYPVVPPVNCALEMTEQTLGQARRHLPGGSAEEAVRLLRGTWFVSFFCSWDTDALGLPQTLNVLVDKISGEVQPA